MRRDIYIDFVRHFIECQKIQNDDFVSAETIKKVNEYAPKDDFTYHRVLTDDELRVITPEAFKLFYFWAMSGEIELNFMERFLAILVLYKDKIVVPIEPESITTMIEMMEVAHYQDHVIYTTIELYINSLDLLKKDIKVIH